MERRWFCWAVVFASALLTFFVGLGSAQLFDEDEPKNAECAREMFARGDWLVPTFNEELRTDKPILVYWLMLTSYHLFGVTEFAARFWSAVLGLGTCLLTYNIGRVLFSRRVGMWAGVMLSSTLMFTTVARASTPDSTLIFFTTLSLFLFVRLGHLKPQGEPSLDWRDRLPKSSAAFLAIYSAMALAVLAKGPVGVLLPSVVIGCFLYSWAVIHRPPIEDDASSEDRELFDGENHNPKRKRGIGFVPRLRFGLRLKRWFQPAEFFRIAWGMRPFWIVVSVAVIALPWYVAVGLKTHGAWLEGFLGQHNVGRFLKPMEGHHGPVLYYPIAMLIGFFPWSVFCLPVIRGVVQRLKRESAEFPGLLFVACWFLTYLVFFTSARTKLPNYVLPCYPAMALLTAWWFERAGEAGVFQKVQRDFTWAAWSLIGTGVAMSIGLGMATSLLLTGETVLALAGLVPFLGGFAAWWALKNRGLVAARIAFACVGVMFVLTMFVWAAPRISRHQDGAYFAGQIRSNQSQSGPVATYNYFPVGLVFYAERPIDRCRVPAEISDVLSAPKGLLITRADRLDELKPYLPPGTNVLARRQRFLRQHDIVILGQPKTPLAVAGKPGESPRN